MQIVVCRNSEERIWLAKYRLNKSPRQGTDFHKTILKITNEKNIKAVCKTENYLGV